MAESRILVAVPEHPRAEGAGAEQLRKIRDAVEAEGFGVRWAVSAEDADAVLRTEAGLAAALVAWELPGGERAVGDGPGAALAAPEKAPGGAAVLRRIGRRYRNLPVFLVMAEEGRAGAAAVGVGDGRRVRVAAGGHPGFIAGRITSAARAYREDVLPPFFRALRRFHDAHEYSWHTRPTPAAWPSSSRPRGARLPRLLR
ncbi:hypothetical protein LT493_10715 [Streptomyces tricolor]|nr:hypothetical protein [Streptomyces tricolor]